MIEGGTEQIEGQTVGVAPLGIMAGDNDDHPIGELESFGPQMGVEKGRPPARGLMCYS